MRARSSRPRRATYSRFLGIPQVVIQSANFRKLSAHALALLVDIREQYDGKNNGRLDATWSRLSQRHRWRSKETLNYAIKELLHYGLIRCESRGRHIAGHPCPSLYSITWEAVADYPQRHITGTIRASNEWQEEKPLWERPRRRCKIKQQLRPA